LVILHESSKEDTVPCPPPARITEEAETETDPAEVTLTDFLETTDSDRTGWTHLASKIRDAGTVAGMNSEAVLKVLMDTSEMGTKD
jgi:hypothetical protein